MNHSLTEYIQEALANVRQQQQAEITEVTAELQEYKTKSQSLASKLLEANNAKNTIAEEVKRAQSASVDLHHEHQRELSSHQTKVSIVVKMCLCADASPLLSDRPIRSSDRRSQRCEAEGNEPSPGADQGTGRVSTCTKCDDP
mgnify:CR=1 FL=1